MTRAKLLIEKFEGLEKFEAYGDRTPSKKPLVDFKKLNLKIKESSLLQLAIGKESYADFVKKGVAVIPNYYVKNLFKGKDPDITISRSPEKVLYSEDSSFTAQRVEFYSLKFSDGSKYVLVHSYHAVPMDPNPRRTLVIASENVDEIYKAYEDSMNKLLKEIKDSDEYHSEKFNPYLANKILNSKYSFTSTKLS